MSTELKEQIARALQRENARYGRENGIEATYESLAEAVMAVLREQEPAGLFTRSDDGGLVQAHDGMPLYAAPVPPAASAVPEGWQLVPTAESRHRGIYEMLAELHIADRTPGLSEWDSYRAMLAAAPKPKCSACGGRGMINPVNSGDPQDEVYCPDCAGPKPDNFERAGAIISTWPKWKQDYRLVPGAAPKTEGE